MLPTPVELRDYARRYLDAARKSVDPDTKRRLSGYAAALAQVAEAIERHAGFAEIVSGEKLDEYRRLIARALEPEARQLVEGLLLEHDTLALQRERIRLWRLRAEEMRATADHFVIPSAEDSLRRAAANYDRLADTAEAILSGRQPKPSSETG